MDVVGEVVCQLKSPNALHLYHDPRQINGYSERSERSCHDMMIENHYYKTIPGKTPRMQDTHKKTASTACISSWQGG